MSDLSGSDGRQQYPPYSMRIEWSDEDNAFIAMVPELPGCITHGSTYEEAVRQGKDAMESWVDVARELGRPLPEPRQFVLKGTERQVSEYEAKRAG